jgi:hypothetical protein
MLHWAGANEGGSHGFLHANFFCEVKTTNKAILSQCQFIDVCTVSKIVS